MILSKYDPICLESIANALCAGKVVIIPTDTVYGFSGLVPASETAIRGIKGREETKPFIQLIANPDDILLYTFTSIPPEVKRHMPGALTIIVQNAQSPQQTTAFRCPNDEWLRSLISRCGKPLYSTSVNRSGQAILSDIHEMEKEFGKEVFCIVDGKNYSIEGAKSMELTALPSTIVDITGDTMKIVRQGSIRF